MQQVQLAAPTPPAHSTEPNVPRGFSVAVLALAAALLVHAVLGPLVLHVVSYPLSETLENQLIGLELVTVFLVVPWAGAAAVAGLRGRSAAPMLAFGPAAYAAYMFVQYVLGPEYGDYSVVALMDVAIFTLSVIVTLWAWALTRHQPLPLAGSGRRRKQAILLLALAVFVLARYVGALVGSVRGDDIPAEFAAARTFYWSIFLLDLGLVVPLTLVAAVAVLRETRLGQRAWYATLGWFALVPPSVVAMALVMLVRDDPHASPTTVVILAVACLVFAAVAGHAYRPLFRFQQPLTEERTQP